MQIKHYHFETIDSTNNWAKTNTNLFNKAELTTITADFQTAGRGRFSRKWISPPKQNLLITFVLWSAQYHFNIPQVLALSAADMLHNRGFDIKLKWPNDLLLNGKKLSGILSETVQDTEGHWLITGIGINLNMPPEELNEIDQPATSLLNESDRLFDPSEMGHLLTAYFSKQVAHYTSFRPFYERYKEKLIHQPGDPVTIGEFSGTFKSLNPDGSITLTLNNGTDKIFISGEIV
ncbi:MAG: biotin--[acetyl-CoA-carboxylase] ligase [Chlamydiia bacterium]|nr:biotin--[acetyl-CoA-carboxylase] ligase [Chlamydiia bacterium]